MKGSAVRRLQFSLNDVLLGMALVAFCLGTAQYFDANDATALIPALTGAFAGSAFATRAGCAITGTTFGGGAGAALGIIAPLIDAMRRRYGGYGAVLDTLTFAGIVTAAFVVGLAAGLCFSLMFYLVDRRGR